MNKTVQEKEDNAIVPDTCCVCDAKGSLTYYNKERLLLRCASCGVICKVCLPQERYEETLVQHYSDIDPALRVAESRDQMYYAFLDMLEKRKTCGSSLLDVGCGKGFFLVIAAKRGWGVTGVEIAPQLVQQGKSQFGIDLRCGDITTIDLTGKTFDVITFWNVLEEIDAMPEALACCARLLKPGGMLFIRTPNSLFHRISARMITFLTRVRLHNLIARHSSIFHRFSFSNTVIKKLLKKHGFVKLTVRNSCPTSGDPYSVGKGISIIKIIVYGVAQAVYFLTFGRVCLSSSLEVYAEKGYEQ
jgi:2-polyprenyl-3-methyl-5-hydroxy-6-metoxy-1,4-benzoquinol methylase